MTARIFTLVDIVMTITVLLSELFQTQFKKLNLKISLIGSTNQTPIDLLRPRAGSLKKTAVYNVLR